MGAAHDTQGLILLTPEQLTKLVRDAVNDALGKGASAERYITLEEAAKELGASTKTVRAWVKNDGLPAVKAGPEYRFRYDKLIAWLESRAVRPGVDVTKAANRLKRAK